MTETRGQAGARTTQHSSPKPSKPTTRHNSRRLSSPDGKKRTKQGNPGRTRTQAQAKRGVLISSCVFSVSIFSASLPRLLLFLFSPRELSSPGIPRSLGVTPGSKQAPGSIDLEQQPATQVRPVSHSASQSAKPSALPFVIIIPTTTRCHLFSSRYLICFGFPLCVRRSDTSTRVCPSDQPKPEQRSPRRDSFHRFTARLSLAIRPEAKAVSSQSVCTLALSDSDERRKREEQAKKRRRREETGRLASRAGLVVFVVVLVYVRLGIDLVVWYVGATDDPVCLCSLVFLLIPLLFPALHSSTSRLQWQLTRFSSRRGQLIAKFALPDQELVSRWKCRIFLFTHHSPSRLSSLLVASPVHPSSSLATTFALVKLSVPRSSVSEIIRHPPHEVAHARNHEQGCIVRDLGGRLRNMSPR